jgi:hypothetical protein
VSEGPPCEICGKPCHMVGQTKCSDCVNKIYISGKLKTAVFEAMTAARENGEDELDTELEEVVTDLCDYDADIEHLKNTALDEEVFMAETGRYVAEWRTEERARRARS